MGVVGLVAIWGLIPARAGNTLMERKNDEYHRAHPRSRGEHTNQEALLCEASGSSPLARGTRPMSRLDLKNNGLIPARAGNTRQSCRS